MPFLQNNMKDDKEIPVTSKPIFEGYLYIKVDKKWKLRLFRFDGTNFTCLTTKKISSDNENILLSTPKHKQERLTNENFKVKYHQQPEWTIELTHISSISLFKKNKLCFIIRTSSKKFILKSKKLQDLERWIFILTKMWNFTKTIKEIELKMQDNDDNIPLVHSIHHSSNPLLSNEKIKVIEEWRKSLIELMENDPNIIKIPPPIESIPDDDTMSIFSDMTSVSRRKKPIIVKRKSTLTSSKYTLKKKKSNEICKNWMNGMHYFQDNITNFEDPTTDSYHIHHLKYHSSIRGKRIQQKGETTNITKRNSMPLNNNMNFLQLSPLQLISNYNLNDDDEEISLADLQKSLKKINLNNSIVSPILPPYPSSFYYYPYNKK